MTLSIDYKILNPLIKEHIPTYASEGSAGLDLRACINDPIVINPGKTELIPTGISIFIQEVMKVVDHGTSRGIKTAMEPNVVQKFNLVNGKNELCLFAEIDEIQMKIDSIYKYFKTLIKPLNK